MANPRPPGNSLPQRLCGRSYLLAQRAQRLQLQLYVHCHDPNLRHRSMLTARQATSTQTPIPTATAARNAPTVRRSTPTTAQFTHCPPATQSRCHRRITRVRDSCSIPLAPRAGFALRRLGQILPLEPARLRRRVAHRPHQSLCQLRSTEYLEPGRLVPREQLLRLEAGSRL